MVASEGFAEFLREQLTPLAAVTTKRERLPSRRSVPGFVGTVSEAIDLIGQYRDAGIELLIQSDRWNDIKTHELFVSDVMPHE
jgi:hypothetical protein